MKRYILILLCLMLPALSLKAQKIEESKVPAPVLKTFKAQFPKMQMVTWSEDKNEKYMAHFSNAGAPCTMTIDKNGKWLETVRSIPVNALPDAPKASVDKNFEGYMIESVDKVNNDKDGLCYDAKIKKGDSAYNIRMNKTGDVISKDAVGKIAETKE
jgi:hypothetical protein